jgi:hypothetical protein
VDDPDGLVAEEAEKAMIGRRRRGPDRAYGLLLLVTLLASWTNPAFAQSQQAAAPAPPRVSGGVGILGAVPVGDFAAHVETAGGGLGHFDVRLGRGPFRLGAEIGYLEYGNTQRTVPLGGLVPDVPDATLKVDTSNAMLLVHGRIRAQRSRGRWRPYADGLVGFTDLFTKTSIEGGVSCSTIFGSTSCTSSSIASATNSRDFVLTYGAAGGVTYGLSPRWGRLDLGWRYVRGGHARYLTEGAIRIEGTQAVYEFSESRTDTVALYIGLAWPH